MTAEGRTARSVDRWTGDVLDGLLAAPPGPSARMVGQVFAQASLPITNGTYYAVHPVDIGGTEAEGQPGAFAVDGAKVCYFLVLGTQAPAAGELLVARSIGGRWVAWRGRTGGGGLVITTGCPCPNGPNTIFLTHTGGSSGAYNPAWHSGDTLTWSAPLVPGTGINGWVGATAWTDFSVSSGALLSTDYRYTIRCLTGGTTYVLQAMYEFSDGSKTFGSPSWSWQIGVSGNTCSPTWQLTNGTGNTGYPTENLTAHG